MSHRSVNGPEHPWRRALLIAICLLTVLGIIVWIGFLTAEPDDHSTLSSSSTWLVPVPGGVAATSLAHGPAVNIDGRAFGFRHDELGAAIAASNITARLSAGASTAIVRSTLTHQCWSDVAGPPSAVPPGPTPGRTTREMYYRVLAGDPDGDSVLISLLADSGRSHDLGGYTRVDAVLRWSDDDWQLKVPLPTPMVRTTAEGYTLLGARA
jgi:hypothetical protein